MNTIIILISLLCSFTVFSSVEPGQVIKAVQFNSSTAQLGEIKQSILTVSQFQSLNGSCWVLMDGQSIEGKALSTIIGQTNIPDARGLFFRSLDNGKGIDSNRVLGSTQTQSTALPTNPFTTDTDTHSHTYTLRRAFDADGNTASNNIGRAGSSDTATNRSGAINSASHSHLITSGGDTETRPANIAVNYFIKVDNCE